MSVWQRVKSVYHDLKCTIVLQWPMAGRRVRAGRARRGGGGARGRQLAGAHHPGRNVTMDMGVWQEEIFAPVLVCLEVGAAQEGWAVTSLGLEAHVRV